MQHIPDNEFDRLFKDRLMDAEMQAPEGLWERMVPQIAPKKKRNTGMYWSAAATVLIALSAGLLFKPQEKIALQAPVATTAAVSPDIQSTTPDLKSETEVSYADVAAGTKSDVDAQAFTDEVITAPVSSALAEEKSSAAMQPVVEENHHNISVAVEEPKLAAIRTDSNPVTETIAADVIVPGNDDPARTAAFEEPATEQPQARPRIRNAGDLVNFVVDKLDKREQKFLEFQTDEDESSSLVAINIGPLKINQRRHNK